MFKSHMKPIAAGLVLATLLIVSRAQAQTDPNNSVLLDDLTSGRVPSITVGDKVFSEFTYTPFGDMPDAPNVNVLEFVDGDGNFGFTLQGAFLDLPGDPNGSSAILEFDVDVSDEGQQKGQQISDAHLFLGGSGVGDDSEFFVEEAFNVTNDTISVYDSDLRVPNKKLADWIFFDDTYLGMRVTLSIDAFADPNAILIARATAIDVSFSQIPEPTCIVLLIMACASAPLRWRR